MKDFEGRIYGDAGKYGCEMASSETVIWVGILKGQKPHWMKCGTIVCTVDYDPNYTNEAKLAARQDAIMIADALNAYRPS